MDFPWMEAILRLAASQSKIKVRVDYVTPDMKLIIYILQQSFQALFCARPDFNNNFLLWRNNKKSTFSGSLDNLLFLRYRCPIDGPERYCLWLLNRGKNDSRGLKNSRTVKFEGWIMPSQMEGKDWQNWPAHIYAKFIFHLFLCVEIDLQCDFLNCLPFSLPKLKMPTRQLV